MTTGAVLSLVLFIAIFTFYGLRWFEGGNLKGTIKRTTSWPPIVNACPDFMVSVKEGSKTYCYDAKNIYGLKQAPSVPGISTFTLNGTQQTGFEIKNDQATNQNAVSLIEDSGSTKKWNFLNYLKTSGDSLFRDPSGKNIRWEGVFDGSALNLGNAPLP